MQQTVEREVQCIDRRLLGYCEATTFWSVRDGKLRHFQVHLLWIQEQVAKWQGDLIAAAKAPQQLENVQQVLNVLLLAYL